MGMQKTKLYLSLLSTEAEYVALAEACKEGIWILHLLKDFQHQNKLPITIFKDNQSCLKMITNRKFSNRTKHIDTGYHFISKLYEDDIMKFHYCETENMLADMMTKPLKEVKLKSMLQVCGLIDYTMSPWDIVEGEC